MNPQHQTCRRRVIIDCDTSDDDHSNEDSSAEGWVQAPAPPATNYKRTVPPSAQSAIRQRKDSIDSLLSDSSSSLEGYFQRAATISNELLSKPTATIEFPEDVPCDEEYGEKDSNDGIESEKKTQKNPVKTGPDSLSAWSQREDSTDFFLSSEKRPDSSWPKFSLPDGLYNQLFSFQRQGVQWMASLHKAGIGGILGDDMGMGKTYVTLAYLGGLMRTGTIRNALVICPVSVLQSWEKEASKILPRCTSHLKITVISSDSMSRRARLETIAKVARKPIGSHRKCNLVITSYGLIRSATDDFAQGSNTVWHYAVLDEGHQIKNSAAEISKACRAVCSQGTRRLLLTGTPILNNLRELWSLFDFATSGEVLGNSKQFAQYYANHIEAARDRLASESEIQLGQRKNTELQEKIRPYFLQRLKIDFLKDKLPKKHDIVVWTHLSEEQRRRYTKYVNSSGGIVRSILTGAVKSPLEGVTWLKKLCGHPLLVEDGGNLMRDGYRAARREGILRQSAKLQALVSLMVHLNENKHRVLIFSQSTKMLDMIHFVMSDRFSMSRIDGSTPGKDRQRLVDEFNDDNSPYDAMLLSTKAAGCGLTLTGADTAIVYDPSWTPAEDAQAVDRCYRIGQTKEVTVYRLIAAGTVEEKTYEKQIYKDGIRRAVLSQDQQVERYFERNELRDLFKLGDYGECRVKEKLKHCRVDWKRYEFVSQLSGVVGISRHDGFYNTEGGEDKAAFDGSKDPEGPEIVGRSQRILGRPQREPSLDVEIVEPPPRRQQHIKASSGNENISSEDFSTDTVRLNGSKSNEKENDESMLPTDSNIHRSNAPDTDDDIISKMFDSADQHLQNGRPRKGLEVLVDMIEPGTLQGEQKLRAHKTIASVAQTLDLI